MTPEPSPARQVVRKVLRPALLAWFVAAAVISALAAEGLAAWGAGILGVGALGSAPWLLEPILGGRGRGGRTVVGGLVVATVCGALATFLVPGAAQTMTTVALAALVVRERRSSRVVVVAVVASTCAAVVALVLLTRSITWTSLAVAVSSVVAGVAIGAIIRGRRETATAQAASAADRLAAAESRAQNAALLERARLARELHDVLAHSLGGLVLQLDAADALAEAGRDDEVRTAVRRAHGLAVDGLREARDAVAALRASGTLAERLTALVDTEADAGVQVQLLLPDGLPELPGPQAHALERVAREALTNVRKHAQGASVDVRVEVHGHDTVLTVADDGGTATAVSSTGSGRGLRGMTERLAAVGGQLEAGPDGSGWVVRARVGEDERRVGGVVVGGE